LAERISFDAEVVELRLPEDRRIQVRSVRELEKIAGILRKPILRELIRDVTPVTGSNPTMRGSCALAVYDGPWVYYCELQAEPEGREGPAQ
jgi:hypothetical protein